MNHIKKVINNKLYDTEKSKCIFSYKSQFPSIFSISGMNLPNWHYSYMYKTPKGSYFKLDKTIEVLEVVEEDYVKNILKDIDPDLYMEMFNETIEEA